MERYGFIYIKGDKKPAIYLFNQITGMKRYVSSNEAKVLTAAKNADWAARVTLPQEIVDSFLEWKYTAGTTL
jgi:hypothetical protein